MQIGIIGTGLAPGVVSAQTAMGERRWISRPIFATQRRAVLKTSTASALTPNLDEAICRGLPRDAWLDRRPCRQIRRFWTWLGRFCFHMEATRAIVTGA